MNYLEDERLGVRSQMLYRLPQAKLSNLYFESFAKERDGEQQWECSQCVPTRLITTLAKC